MAYYRFASPLTFRLASFFPVVAPLALYLVFTSTEYFRSWEFYRQYYDSIWQFSYDRLTAYYAVASNNGIGLLTESTRWPSYDGSYVFQWAYPRPEEDGSNFLRTVAQHDYKVFLENYARPELNNPSGIFPIVYDIGYLGSALYLLVVGVLVGIAYRALRQGHLGGVLFYPACVLFLIELLRFNYFAASRFIPIAAALFLILFLLTAVLPGGCRTTPEVLHDQPCRPTSNRRDTSRMGVGPATMNGTSCRLAPSSPATGSATCVCLAARPPPLSARTLHRSPARPPVVRLPLSGSDTCCTSAAGPTSTTRARSTNTSWGTYAPVPRPDAAAGVGQGTCAQIHRGHRRSGT